jgi:serine/threonine protein kinase
MLLTHHPSKFSMLLK